MRNFIFILATVFLVIAVINLFAWSNNHQSFEIYTIKNPLSYKDKKVSKLLPTKDVDVYISKHKFYESITLREERVPGSFPGTFDKSIDTLTVYYVSEEI